MAKARLMNRPEDYKMLGVNPDKIELWEDGRRSQSDKGTWEWWYFDAMLDDGTSVVIQFFTKSSGHTNSDKDHPKFKIRITRPDGTEYKQGRDFSVGESSWSKLQCDVRYGNNFFTGDLQEYSIYVEPLKGIGADLKLHSLSRPYRPGSAYLEFGEAGRYYTWFCTVPKGEVSGTLTIQGQEIPVHGYGYHDHQWGNVTFVKEWNHWVWARQSFEDYSMLVFDMVSNQNTEYTRFPIVFIQDSEGNLVFESTDNVQCEILEEYQDDVSEKTYPGAIHYVFENNGKKADYTLRMQKIIENNGKNNLPLPQKLLMKTLGIDGSYTRYEAVGSLVLTDGAQKIEREGTLIYEFMYPGKSYQGHM
ncbi:MAG: lipocalin-like domain-containing protein [Eubacteriales bacterium]|nr:lipocalin-like domain-containing protein [Eubacteriales bacterium]